VQRPRRENVYGHAQKRTQLVSNLPYIEDGRLRRGINENIKIALFGIFSVKDRPEDSRVLRTPGFHNAADIVSV
jgi:hypothetical protein